MAADDKKNIVLLGDSVFDNGSYISGSKNVRWQVQAALPKGWQATLVAVDGNTTKDIRGQLTRLPADASHLVISVGGNDGLGQMGVFGETVHSIAEALNRMAAVIEIFQRDYQFMLQDVLRRKLPTAVCTIYYPRFPDAALQRLVVTGLASFNDIILVEAIRAGLPVLDLRQIFDDPDDYANPIEPSIKGGEKIATALTTLLLEHDFERGRTEVYSREY